MNSPLETYPVSIPSVAFGLMVRRLAVERAMKADDWPWWFDTPPTRYCRCEPCKHLYQIHDRLARGEQP